MWISCRKCCYATYHKIQALLFNRPACTPCWSVLEHRSHVNQRLDNSGSCQSMGPDLTHSLRNTISLQSFRFSHSYPGGTPWWVTLCQTSTYVGQTHAFSPGCGSRSTTPCKTTSLSMNLPDSFIRRFFVHKCILYSFWGFDVSINRKDEKNLE